MNSFLRIANYATASTSESVLIIGGYTCNGGGSSACASSTIAEYKDGSWTILGNLAQARYQHAVITSRSDTMVVGGRSLREPSTELWDMNSRETQIIDPTLPLDKYTSAGMFLVDEGFCSKN